MNIDQIDRNTAAEVLVRDIVNQAYKGVVEGVLRGLQSSLVPTDNEKELYDWFHSLGIEGQSSVKALMSLTAKDSIFSVFAVLDGTTGGLRLEKSPEGQEIYADYALGLDIYKGSETGIVLDDGTVNDSIFFKITNIDGGEDLHDIFQAVVDEF